MANENITTTSGLKIYVGGESTAKTKAEFEAHTWAEIGAVSDIGSFGDKRELVPLELIGEGRRIKRAGVRDAGTLTLKVARDSFSAGQSIIRDGLDGGKPHAFKIVLPDRPTGTNGKPTTIYVLGVILSAEIEIGGANSYIMQNFVVDLTDAPLEIPASV